jgi:hypothetical protein
LIRVQAGFPSTVHRSPQSSRQREKHCSLFQSKDQFLILGQVHIKERDACGGGSFNASDWFLLSLSLLS